MSQRSKLLSWGLPIAGIGALFAGAITIAANRPVQRQGRPARQPITAPVQESGCKPIAFIGAIGLTEPPGEAIQISSHTAGIVEQVLVKIGDQVEVGQPLFRIDTRRAESLLRLRERERAVADASLQVLKGQIPTARAQVAAAEAGLLSAETVLTAAQADEADRLNQFKIVQAVSDPRAIAAEIVETRRFAWRQAEARVAQAKAKIAEAEATLAVARSQLSMLVVDAPAGDGPEMIAAMERVAQADAEVDRQRTELELLTVRSPVVGSVIQVNLRPGEYAPSKELKEGLVVLARAGPTRIRAQIDEVDIPRFDPKAKAWASPRGDVTRRLPVTVVSVEPLVVPKTNLAGRTNELVDTRVLEVIFTVGDEGPPPVLGQQMEIYIEARPAGST